MGMFDTLYINTDMLPVSDLEKQIIGKNPEWQTKCFDCELTEIYITDDGDLKINRWKYKEVPKKDRPYPNDNGLLGLSGSLRRDEEHLETIPHNGVVNFYSDIVGDWYEFYAKFTNGKLESIEGGRENKDL